MDSIGWLIAFVILLGIELTTLALTTIWFAGGAMIAFILSLFNVSIEMQFFVFVVVSLVLLLFTRPFASKYLNQKTVKTNVDSLIGRQAKVTKEINSDLEPGVAVVGGQEWSARAEQPESVFQIGEMVTIAAIRGVTLYVKKMEER